MLLNIDYQKTSNAFAKLGANQFDLLFSQAKQNEVFSDFEKGIMIAKDFRNYLREETQIPMTDAEIDHAWNAMLLDFPLFRLNLLEKLKKDYFLILMSNTNTIHLKAFTNIVNESFGIQRFENAFHQVYYSSDIGKRKPDPDCFHWILSQNKFSAEDCFFIDDSIQHIQSAQKIGIESFHLHAEKNLLHLFKK